MGASFGIGAILLLPVLLTGTTAWLHTTDGIALALYLGLVPTALAYVLFARGLLRLDASEVTTLVLAEPLTATVLGALVLDERVGLAVRSAPRSCSQAWRCSRFRSFGARLRRIGHEH